MRTSTKSAIGVIIIFILVGGFSIMLGSQSIALNSGTDPPQSQEANSEMPATEQTSISTQDTPESRETTTTEAPTTDERLYVVQVNESEIQHLIAVEINQRRADGTELLTDSKTAAALTKMAERHSSDMANTSTLAHDVGDGNSKDRYQEAGLYSKCQFKVEQYIESADGNRLEAIASLEIRQYERESIDQTERTLAETVVENWFSHYRFKEHLSYRNAEFLGVGVDISERGQLYVTANVC